MVAGARNAWVRVLYSITSRCIYLMGCHSVDCQWICQKSDLRSYRKRQKTKQHHKNSEEPSSPSSTPFSTFRKFSNHWGNSNPDKVDPSRVGLGDKDHSERPNDGEEKHTSQENLGGMNGTRCMLYAHGGEKLVSRLYATYR
jgi:hypothetical protein